MSDKTRGNLKRELELMPKMGFGGTATREQKIERARAVQELLDADLRVRLEQDDPICDEAEYRSALKEVSLLFDLPEPELETAEHERLMRLIKRIERYEALHYRVSSVNNHAKKYSKAKR